MGERIAAHLRAHVVGYVALFVALGGTAYAAATVDSGDVVNNSLRSADLKNNKAVKGADVKANSLTGADVRADSLTGADVGPDSLTGGDVADDSLSGADVDEATLDGVDAATLDGLPRPEYLFRSFVSGPASREESMVFYSYLMVTPEAGTDYFVGAIKLQTTATAGEFRICGAIGLPGDIAYVLYLNGTRSTGNVDGLGCTAPFDAGPGGDFEVAALGTRVFATPTQAAAEEDYYLLALQST